MRSYFYYSSTSNQHHFDQKSDEAFFQKGEDRKSADPSQINQNSPSFFTPSTIRTKPASSTGRLKIGRPNDRYEQEADAMADKVVGQEGKGEGQGVTQVGMPGIQTKCAECTSDDVDGHKDLNEGVLAASRDEESPLTIHQKDSNELTNHGHGQSGIQCNCSSCTAGREDEVQRKSDGGQSFGPPDLSTRLNHQKGQGSPLPDSTRASMESGFGVDFQHVNIHTGDQAVQMNQSLGAQAFTYGSDIYFNKGKYQPETTDGKHLLAHELTHVVQQNKTNLSRNNQPSLETIQRKTKGLCKLTAYNDPKKYVEAKVKDGDRISKMARRLIKAGLINVQGSVSVYANKITDLNLDRGAILNIGDCIVFIKNWIDHRIGKLPSTAAGMHSSIKNKIIATIYSEQTRNEPDQHKYIWLSMRKRLESWERPAKFVYPGKKRGILSQYDAFGNDQYEKAKHYLNTGKNPYPSNKFNPAVVDSIKSIVTKNWTNKIPSDAGMFYFHWTEKKSPSLNSCWKQNKDKAYDQRELYCANKWKDQLKWKANFVKKIGGKKDLKNDLPPFGRMYVFQSTKKP